MRGPRPMMDPSSNQGRKNENTIFLNRVVVDDGRLKVYYVVQESFDLCGSLPPWVISRDWQKQQRVRSQCM